MYSVPWFWGINNHIEFLCLKKAGGDWKTLFDIVEMRLVIWSGLEQVYGSERSYSLSYTLQHIILKKKKKNIVYGCKVTRELWRPGNIASFEFGVAARVGRRARAALECVGKPRLVNSRMMPHNSWTSWPGIPLWRCIDERRLVCLECQRWRICGLCETIMARHFTVRIEINSSQINHDTSKRNKYITIIWTTILMV